MEVTGTVIRQTVCRLPGRGDTFPFEGHSRVRIRQRAVIAVRPWSDDGHRLYYASPPRCGGVKVARRKEEKRRAALVTELSRDLAALYPIGLKMDDGKEISDELRANMITEAAKLLLAQLNQQKAREKEMKKRKKEEKAARKAAKMRKCTEALSSSSSSSESSDSNCEEAEVTTNKPEENLKEVKNPDNFNVPVPEEQSPAAVKAAEKIELYNSALKLEQDCSISSVLAATMPLEKIEVCMGGKCKRSGAAELLQEFQKKVGIEGAVVGCKCMGKCREGPNVRLVNHSSDLQDKLVIETSKEPLCIGVGLDDVGGIVASFLGENNMAVGLFAA